MKGLRLGVIGDPIGHTLSPIIHQTMADKLGIPCSYEAFHVTLAELPGFVEMVKREGFHGFNITIPHKRNILPYLAEVDAYAERCGAVNTVKIVGGKLYGSNTDGDGLKSALGRHGVDFTGEVLLLGAGGAALSICQKALESGAEKLTVLCRSPQKAAAFQTDPRVQVGELSPNLLLKCGKSADLIINATPLGMSGIAGDFTDFTFLEETHAAVCDIVYKPAETTLLRESRKRGLIAMNGLGMLISQAVYAFETFSGATFDKDAMSIYLEEQLKKVIYG